MLKKMRAQSLSDYTILLGIVVAFSVTMFPMVKRGTQSILKAGADQIGQQNRSEQSFSQESGYVVGMNSSTEYNSTVDKSEWPGVMQTVTKDKMDVISTTYTNLGFTEDN